MRTSRSVWYRSLRSVFKNKVKENKKFREQQNVVFSVLQKKFKKIPTLNKHD